MRLYLMDNSIVRFLLESDVDRFVLDSGSINSVGKEKNNVISHDDILTTLLWANDRTDRVSHYSRSDHFYMWSRFMIDSLSTLCWNSLDLAYRDSSGITLDKDEGFRIDKIIALVEKITNHFISAEHKKELMELLKLVYTDPNIKNNGAFVSENLEDLNFSIKYSSVLVDNTEKSHIDLVILSAEILGYPSISQTSGQRALGILPKIVFSRLRLDFDLFNQKRDILNDLIDNLKKG